MKNLIISIVVALLVIVVAFALICKLFASEVYTANAPVKKIHVVVQAEDENTEIEIKIDGQNPHTKILKSGVSFLPYKTKEEKPKVRILAYGDKLYPKVEKAGGEWYTFISVKPPRKSWRC